MNQIVEPSPAARFLALDRTHGVPPSWRILAQALSSDQRPAVIEGTGSQSRYGEWDQVCAWTKQQAAVPDLSLVPVGYFLIWHITTSRSDRPT